MEIAEFCLDSAVKDSEKIGKPDIHNISMKHEIETAQDQQHDVPSFETFEFKVATIKIEEAGLAVANVVKTELIEFQSNNNNNDVASSDFNENKNEFHTVMFKKIPNRLKTETKFLLDDDVDPSYSINEENDLYNNYDADPDPERDPFADVNCDPGFSQTPVLSSNPQDFDTHVGLSNAADAINGSSSSSEKGILPTASTQNHLRCKSQDAKLQCRLCLKIQASKEKLTTHIQICAAFHSNRWRFCVLCNKLFGHLHKYRSHALEIYGNKEAAEVRRFPLNCQFCTRSFAMKESLSNHLALHSADSTESSSPSSTVNNKGGLNLAGLFKCQECSSSFANLSTLTHHLRIHKNERRFKCSVSNCGKAFNYKSNLQEHLQQIHSEKKPFKCPEPNCGKTLKGNASLQVHIIAFHSEETPFKCLHHGCYKNFKIKRYLTLHLAVHNGGRKRTNQKCTERSFICDKCARAYSYKRSLTLHLKTHSESENNIFVCPESNCNFAFRYKQGLARHIANIHTLTNNKH